MHINQLFRKCFLFAAIPLLLNGCASEGYDSQVSADGLYNGFPLYQGQPPYSNSFDESRFASRMPATIDDKHRVVVVNPRAYAWGAYEDGQLVKGGMASAGADYCPDQGKSCRTHVGTFHVSRVGSEDCVSHQFPVGQGGSLMPYCMFFSQGQSLHGSPDQMMVENNISHGCVHMRIPDAAWLRNDFVNVGTKVIIMPYD